MIKPINPHVLNVCKLGQGRACCRYLMAGPNGWACAKLSTSLKLVLDERVKSLSINARGDNCPGQPAQFLNSENS